MLMRDSTTGQFEVYDVSNNNITSAAPMGQVGLEWQVAGFGDFSSNPGETDMLMRNSNTGAFEVYDISNSNTGAFEVYDISNNAVASAASRGRSGWSGRLPASGISAAIQARATC
jgi:hypothetical protein